MATCVEARCSAVPSVARLHCSSRPVMSSSAQRHTAARRRPACGRRSSRPTCSLNNSTGAAGEGEGLRVDDGYLRSWGAPQAPPPPPTHTAGRRSASLPPSLPPSAFASSCLLCAQL